MCQRLYNGQGFLVVKHTVDVVDNLSWVIVGDLAGPASPDALGSVHQHHRYYGYVPLWLHLLVVIIQELQQTGVHSGKQQFGQWAKRRLKQIKTSIIYL